MASPVIEAKQQFLSQTSALAKTAIFTPTTSGLFRLTIYLNVASGTGGVTPFFYWTDTIGAQSAQFDPSNLGTPVSYTMLVYCVSGDAISVSTNVTGTNTYNLYAVVEQL
jgi:hypothetical protein